MPARRSPTVEELPFLTARRQALTLTARGATITIQPMNPPLVTPGSHWIADQRGGGRGVRVSAHTEAGFLVLSTWKEDAAVATVRLLPDEAAALVAGIADGLSRLAEHPTETDLALRLASVEARMAALESNE